MTTPYLSDRRPPGPLGRALALLGGAVLLVLGFMFSLVLLAVAAIIVAGAAGYLWWKTRELRRQLRTQGPATPDGGMSGQVFDGEAVRIEGEDDRTQRR